MIDFDQWWNSGAADDFRAKHEDLSGECFRPVWDAAMLAAAPQPPAPSEHPAFDTSAAGRAEVARFFRDHLKHHDFTRYIEQHLAADFACALAPTLHRLMTTPSEQRKPLTPDRVVLMMAKLNAPCMKTGSPLEMFELIVKAVEAEHGIRSTGGDHDSLR